MIDTATEGCGVAEGRLIEAYGTIRVVKGACSPDSAIAVQWPALLEHDLIHYRPRVVILLAGYWEVFDRTDLAGHFTNITHPIYARYVKDQLLRFVSIAISTGSRVVLMTAPYYDASELPDGQSPVQDDPGRVNDYNDLVREVALADPHSVTLIRLNRIVSPQGRYTSTIGNIIVRAPDGIHFPFYQPSHESSPMPDTLAQVESLARWLDPKLFPLIMKAAHE